MFDCQLDELEGEALSSERTAAVVDDGSQAVELVFVLFALGDLLSDLIDLAIMGNICWMGVQPRSNMLHAAIEDDETDVEEERAAIADDGWLAVDVSEVDESIISCESSISLSVTTLLWARMA